MIKNFKIEKNSLNYYNKNLVGSPVQKLQQILLKTHKNKS